MGWKRLTPTNLEERRGVWFAALRVPANLRQAVGCSVMRRSLKTRDHNQAIARSTPIIKEFREKIAAAAVKANLGVPQRTLDWLLKEADSYDRQAAELA